MCYSQLVAEATICEVQKNNNNYKFHARFVMLLLLDSRTKFSRYIIITLGPVLIERI